jgi:hypothetical protein
MEWLKRKGNKGLLFSIAVLLLFFLALQGQWSQLYAADNTQSTQEETAYPATPEGVVEAFVKTYLEANDYPDSAVTRKYFPNDDDIKANRKTRVIDLNKEWGEASNRTHIATGYEIKEVKKSNRKATVKVLYRRLGWTWSTPIFISECRASHTTKDKEKETGRGYRILETAEKIVYEKKGWIWDKEDCEFLYISNDMHEVIYHLAKPGKFWRIISTFELHVSVSTKIKGLYRLKNSDDPRGTHPSEKQKLEISEAIKFLEKYLKDEKEEVKR